VPQGHGENPGKGKGEREMSKAILVAIFTKSETGLIAKSVSDSGAWIVPGRKEKHSIQPAEGPFIVEITGATPNGRLRFCKVLQSVEAVFADILSGETEITDDEFWLAIADRDGDIRKVLPCGLIAHVKIFRGKVEGVKVLARDFSDLWHCER
jgi:hypothetical protein